MLVDDAEYGQRGGLPEHLAGSARRFAGLTYRGSK
jgi:hypothetical protein